jgi:hypothetical protein
MVLNLSRLQSTLSTIDGERRQRFFIRYFWMKNWDSKKSYQELVNTLRSDPYGRSQIKVWPQKSRNGELSCKDAPRTAQPSLTLGPPLAAFHQKYPCTSARVLAQHFLTNVPTIKEIPQRELVLKNSCGARFPIFCPPPKKLPALKH